MKTTTRSAVVDAVGATVAILMVFGAMWLSMFL